MRKVSNATHLGKDGIIYQEFAPHQTRESVMRGVELITKAANLLRMQNKHILILGDLSGVLSSTYEARREGAKLLRKIEADKAAYFGANTFFKYLVKFIIKASGLDNKVKYFDTKESALNWLKRNYE